jgi:hypothetical protein
VYHKGLIGTSIGVTTLPFTGLNVVWIVVAGFTLLMAAAALWRTIPRRQA